MCTGAELIPLIAAGASGIGSMITANEQQKNAERIAAARNNELQQMRQKNRALSDQATVEFQNRLDQQGAEQQTQKQEENTQQLGQAFDQAVENIPQTAPSIDGSAPSVVQNDLTKQIGEAMARSKARGGKLAQMGGYNQTLFQNGVDTNQAGQQIGFISDQAQRNARMLPYYQDLAEVGANKPGSGIGALLQMGGSLAGAAAGGYFSPKTTTAISGPLKGAVVPVTF